MRLSLGIVGVVVLSSRGLADPGSTVGRFVGALDDAKNDISSTSGYKLSDCTDAIAAARKAGATKLSDFHFQSIAGKDEITLARAEQVCTDYAPYEAVGHRLDLIVTESSIALLTPEMAPGPEKVKGMAADAAKCGKAVDEILAAKVPATFAFKVGGKSYVVGELKAKQCDALAKAVAKYQQDSAAAQKQSHDKYTKVGISGDKLQLLTEYQGEVLLAGGAAPDDLKKYAAASVMFVHTTSDPDAQDMVVHTIRKYQFSGNKLLKTTNQTYRKRRGEKLGDVYH